MVKMAFVVFDFPANLSKCHANECFMLFVNAFSFLSIKICMILVFVSDQLCLYTDMATQFLL